MTRHRGRRAAHRHEWAGRSATAGSERANRQADSRQGSRGVPRLHRLKCSEPCRRRAQRLRGAGCLPLTQVHSAPPLSQRAPPYLFILSTKAQEGARTHTHAGQGFSATALLAFVCRRRIGQVGSQPFRGESTQPLLHRPDQQPAPLGSYPPSSSRASPPRRAASPR